MKTAIFDLDGTLADTLCDLADAVNFGLRELGCPERSLDEIKSFIGNGREKLCIRAMPDDRKDEYPRLCELFDEYYEAHFLDKTVLYDGMRETVKRLSAGGVTLAVATNKPQEFARMIVYKLLPDTEFAAVLGGCGYRPKKPDVSILAEIFAQLPDADNKVWVIGDSSVDIRLAKNAGLESIGCTWGFRERKVLTDEGADHIAEKPSDIAEIILNGGA